MWFCSVAFLLSAYFSEDGRQFPSLTMEGNHPGVIIFDEPNQHSIIPEDMEEFFNSLLDLGESTQIIVGITVKDTDTKSEIEKLPTELYHIIPIANKAFQKIS